MGLTVGQLIEELQRFPTDALVVQHSDVPESWWVDNFYHVTGMAVQINAAERGRLDIVKHLAYPSDPLVNAVLLE
jgi:hypothetical protein